MRGRILRPGKPVEYGRFFHSKSRECAHCDLVSICISNGRPTKSVVISDNYPALLRARRRKERCPKQTRDSISATVGAPKVSRRGQGLAQTGPSLQAWPDEYAHLGVPGPQQPLTSSGSPRSSKCRPRSPPFRLDQVHFGGSLRMADFSTAPLGSVANRRRTPDGSPPSASRWSEITGFTSHSTREEANVLALLISHDYPMLLINCSSNLAIVNCGERQCVQKR